MKPNRVFRESPDLDQLKRQAKELLLAFHNGEPEVVAEVSSHYSASDPLSFALHDAQLVLARSYGFESWPKLKAHVNGINIRRFVEAVKAGDVSEVEAMLRSRPELANMPLSYGDERRPLHFAVMNRSSSIVTLLMRHGADARQGIHPHRDATTALTMAIERGFTEIDGIIRDEEQCRRETMSPAGAGVTNLQDEITEAITNGDGARALALLEPEKALINARDRNGSSPLHVAAAAHSRELVAWLLQNGADSGSRDADNRTPLDCAAASRRSTGSAGFGAIARLLLDGGARLTDRAAAALGDVAWLRGRHEQGLLTNQVSWRSGGLLTIAVRHNQPDVLETLLDFGFDPDEKVTSGEGSATVTSRGYPLWHCAAVGRSGMAELLISRGASLNDHVDSSGSPVYSAFSHRQWEMVDLLRRHGGIVTPDIAAIYRRTGVARELLAAETTGTKIAEELLEFACSGGAPEIVQLALDRIPWSRDDPRWFRYLGRCTDFWNHIPWLYASARELDRGTYIRCLRLLLGRADPNLVGSFGRTVLHEVAAMGDFVTEEETAQFAKALLDVGAITCLRDEILRSTPLGWGCRWGREQMVRLLLDFGADPREIEAESWARPLAWAEKMDYPRIQAILKLAR